MTDTPEPRLHHDADGYQVWHGDCREVMALLPAESVDAVVTDPPYGLEFMGKEWDTFKPSGTVSNRVSEATDSSHPFRDGSTRIRYGRADMRAFEDWCHEWATQAMRVLKPGGHLLAFGGTRTWHRLASGIEDAGFEMRDNIAWLYSTGFPKSLDVSAAIDRQRHNRPELLQFTAWCRDARDRAGISNTDIDDAFGFHGMAGHWTSQLSQPLVPTLDQIPKLLEVLGLTIDDVPAEIRVLIVELNGQKGQPGAAWFERPVTGHHEQPAAASEWAAKYEGSSVAPARERRDEPATEAARAWQGWGSALAPAFEPIVVARKPLVGTIAANTLLHGVGGLNVEANRIESSGRPLIESKSEASAGCLVTV